MDQQNITQLIARVEEISAQAGIAPRLRFAITINNKNQVPFEMLTVAAHLYVQFHEDSRVVPTGLGFYVGEAHREGSSATVGPGDQNYLNLYIAMPFELLGELEEAREGHDLSFQIAVVYTIVERGTSLELKNRYLTAELVDPKVGGNQFLYYPIPKSVWSTLLTQVGYSEELRGSKHTLAQAVANARRAEEQAVLAEQEAAGAAKAAKEAAGSVAVTTLAQAFQQEADSLSKTSRYWLTAAVLLSAVTLALMGFYVMESFGLREFTAGQTLMRVTTLAVMFGGVGLCIRTYNAYQHLELLNRHRVNIGKIFDLFIRSQPSDKAKDVLAAYTAERMISFGRGTSPGKEEADNQLSFVTNLVKALVEREK